MPFPKTSGMYTASNGFGIIPVFDGFLQEKGHPPMFTRGSRKNKNPSALGGVFVQPIYIYGVPHP